MVNVPKVLAVTFSLLIVGTLLAVPALSQEMEKTPASLKVGDVIGDDLMVTTMGGEKIPLKKGFEKEYNLIQFMTTACSACRSELMDIMVFQDSVKDKLAIYPIAMDMAGVPAVERYEKKMMLGVTYLLDTEFTLPPLFGFNSTPSIAILDKEGKVLYTKAGYMPSKKAELESELSAIVK